MRKTNTFRTCSNVLATATIMVALGGIFEGCLPTETGPAQYNTANYSPNTNSTGLVGTWVITLNNEFTPANSQGALYQRELVRLKPITGAPDTYEFTYCQSLGSLTRITVVASGNAITLPLNDGTDRLANYSVTANGRMAATIAADGATPQQTRRAVRLSGNADFNAGTVAVDFADDDIGAIKQPTACFLEHEATIAANPFLKPYSLQATGESSNGYVTISIDKSLMQNNVTGTDGETWVSGLIVTLTTLISDADGLRGSVATNGGDGNPDAVAGSVVLDIKL